MSASQDRPLISIALCTCNGEAHLKAQMDSLLEQDHPNLEIVVVDDASDDATPAIIRDYAQRHPQIAFHANEERLGFVENFQKCLRLCQGEFIALCDQDDVWLPHKISRMANAIGDAALAYSKVRVVDANGQALDHEHPRRHLLQGRCPLSLVLTNFVTGHACLIRNSLLDEALPVPPGHIHDQWLAFCAACSDGGIVQVDEVLSDYRLHGANQILGGAQRTRSRGSLKAFASHSQLCADDAALLEELTGLMDRRFVLYNFVLHRFLKANPALLAAYRRPGRVRRKLCMRPPTGEVSS